MQWPRISVWLSPFQLAVRLIFYINGIAVGILASYIIIRCCIYFAEYMDRTLFAYAWRSSF